jgi:hypothetical protein
MAKDTGLMVSDEDAAWDGDANDDDANSKRCGAVCSDHKAGCVRKEHGIGETHRCPGPPAHNW